MRQKKKKMDAKIFFYFHSIGECCKTQDYERGLKILEEMRAEKLEPTFEFYERFMYLFSLMESESKVEELFNELLERKLSPLESHYTLLISSLAKVGRLDDAMKVSTTHMPLLCHDLISIETQRNVHSRAGKARKELS